MSLLHCNGAQRRTAQTALSASKDEDERAIQIVRSQVDSTVLGLGPGQAAQPHTLARTTAVCDARIAYLVGQLQERLPRAIEANKTMAAIQRLARSPPSDNKPAANAG
jgi:hypothetical protein